MGTIACPTCHGRGVVTDYSRRIQTSESYYTYGEKTCPDYRCRMGYISVEDPKPKPKPRPTPPPPVREKPEEKTSNVQGIIAFIGFLAGSIITYQNSDENLIAAGIVGVIAAFLAGKLYKWIIAIALIAAVLYLISQNS